MKHIVVYTIDNCGYCEAAKSLLRSKNLPFEEFNISSDEKQRRDLIQKTGHRTMPQIFVDDHFVGGFTELKEFFRDNL